MKLKRIAALGALLVLVAVLASACGQTAADVASHNLSVEAEQFRIARRIVVVNTWTDKYLFVVQGYCSVETASSALAGSLEITCKTSGGYKKAFIGLTRGVTYVVQQLDPAQVSTGRYEVIFRPSTLVPDIRVK